jgi:hypothetical protein
MLSIFRTNLPQGLFIYIPFLMVLFHLPYYLNPFPIETSGYNLLLAPVENYLVSSFTVYCILSSILGIAGAIFITNLFNENNFHSNNVILPSLIFVVFWSTISNEGLFFQLALIFIILALWWQFHVEGYSPKLHYFFDIGFFYGLAVLLYPPLIALIALPFIYFLVSRPFSWREFALILVGIGTPFYISSMISFIITDNFFYLNLTRESSAFPSDMPILQLSYLAYLALFSLVMIVFFVSKIIHGTNRMRRMAFHLLLSLPMFLGSYLFSNLDILDLPMLCIIPLTLITSKVLANKNKYVDYGFYLLVVLTLSLNYWQLMT